MVNKQKNTETKELNKKKTNKRIKQKIHKFDLVSNLLSLRSPCETDFFFNLFIYIIYCFHSYSLIFRYCTWFLFLDWNEWRFSHLSLAHPLHLLKILTTQNKIFHLHTYICFTMWVLAAIEFRNSPLLVLFWN